MTTPEPFSPDKSPDRITPSKALETDLTAKQSAAGDFQSFMGKSEGAGKLPGVQTQGTNLSPLNLPQQKGGGSATAPTMDSLVQQTKTIQDGLGVIGDQITTAKSANIKMKRSQSDLLKNKLVDIRDYGKSVAEKVGAQVPEREAPQGGGPLERFLVFLGDGQNQFVAVQKKIEEMSASGGSMNPADMMLIQSKLNIAQQEIEYSSTLLGKVVAAITQLMNTQL
jgi:hypothetical protein